MESGSMGLMGANMAARLVKGGAHRIVGDDRSPGQRAGCCERFIAAQRKEYGGHGTETH